MHQAATEGKRDIALLDKHVPLREHQAASSAPLDEWNFKCPSKAIGSKYKSSFLCQGQTPVRLLGQARVRWQLKRQPVSFIASIGNAGKHVARSESAAKSQSPCSALEGPNSVLRMHAEELRRVASQRARRAFTDSHTHRQHQQSSRSSSELGQQHSQQRKRIMEEGVNHIKHMLAGALSACFSKTIVAPLERVKMDCILQRRGVPTAIVAKEIMLNEGILGFWRGSLLNILRTAPFKAVNFSSYDAYRKLLARCYGQNASEKGNGFVAGAMAGVTASLTCFPLDVVRTRILAAQPGSSPGPFTLMRTIAQTEGISGLYSGVLPALISVAPSGAVFYGTYDVLKSRHLSRQAARGEQEDLGTVFTLLYGGLAGVAAETSVYPLQMLQRHLQLQSHLDASSLGKKALSPKGAVKLVKSSGVGGRVFRSALRLQSAAAVIYGRHGLAGFYTGLVPNVLQVIPNAALSYYAYEAFKRALDARE